MPLKCVCVFDLAYFMDGFIFSEMRFLLAILALKAVQLQNSYILLIFPALLCFTLQNRMTDLFFFMATNTNRLGEF